jgi:hypothetical protein
MLPNGVQSPNQLYKTWKSDQNLVKLGNTPEASEKAQQLVNSGQFVVAAVEKENHVSVVGKQEFTIWTEPKQKWAETKVDPIQGGTGYTSHYGSNSPRVLYDYPVFTQAGAYTGNVLPGFAFNRELFADKKVHFYWYNPRSDK